MTSKASSSTDVDPGPPHNVLVQIGVAIPVLFFVPPLPTRYIDPPIFPAVLYISQAVNFCILLKASIVYEAPQGTVQQIDGPQRLEYETYENMGRLICLHIASWLFSWTYLDFRFLPLAVFAFCYSFWWTPGIIMGRPLLATEIPCARCSQGRREGRHVGGGTLLNMLPGCGLIKENLARPRELHRCRVHFVKKVKPFDH